MSPSAAKIANYSIFKRTYNIDVMILFQIRNKLLKTFGMELLTIDGDTIECFIKHLVMSTKNIKGLSPFVHQEHIGSISQFRGIRHNHGSVVVYMVK